MTSSTKPEVHNVMYCCRRRTVVILDTRVHGPWRRPVNTCSVYRALVAHVKSREPLSSSETSYCAGDRCTFNRPYMYVNDDSQTCQVSRISRETHAFSVNSRISARAEIVSFFRAATHNYFHARFLPEIDTLRERRTLTSCLSQKPLKF